MLNELQLGELAFKCKNNELAKTLLTAAADKSGVIYTESSDGQKIIQAKTAQLLGQAFAVAVKNVEYSASYA